jgi:hypothetical protein
MARLIRIMTLERLENGSLNKQGFVVSTERCPLANFDKCGDHNQYTSIYFRLFYLTYDRFLTFYSKMIIFQLHNCLFMYIECFIEH